MTIGSVSGGNATSYLMNGTEQVNDSYSKNLQKQIANAQKQLQEISSNKELSIEEKMKKRQEIQQQINDLNNLLRQHEIEQRKEQQNRKSSVHRKKTEVSSDLSNRKRTGLSQASMEAMISADISVKQAEVTGSVVTKMEGKAKVLKSEIKQDAALGGNTQKKEEELSEVERTAVKASVAQMSTLGDANRTIKDMADDKDNYVKDTDMDSRENPGIVYKEKVQKELEEKHGEKKEALEKKHVAIAETKEELLKKIKDNWKNYHNKGKLNISNSDVRIIAEAVKVEISSEGLKALKDEEKIAFLQTSLQKACDLYRIETGSDLKSKYDYISTGERMKEYAPEKYAELSTMLEEAFETNSTELYQKAAKYMVDWEKAFAEPHKSIENEIVHYDKKANHLPAYSGIFDVDKTIATAAQNCSKEDQAFVYDIIRNNFLIANSGSMTEKERQANISLGMKKAEYAANDFIDADHREAFLDAMETVAKIAGAGKADSNRNMDYGVNKANYLGSGANLVQTTDPLAVMQKIDSEAYEEYQRLKNAGNKDAESGVNAFKYLIKWYSNAVSSNNKLIENYEKKSQEYVEKKVENQTIDKTFVDIKTENAHLFMQSLMNFQSSRPNFLTSVLQRELTLFFNR